MTKMFSMALSWLEIILKQIKTYGIKAILEALLLLIVITFTVRLIYNPDVFFEKYLAYVELKHEKDKIMRVDNDTKINELLPIFAHELNVDRIWIIQYHNGTMDWTYADVRFTFCRDLKYNLEINTRNIHTSLLQFPRHLSQIEYFIGTIQEMEEVDLNFVKMLNIK